MAQTPSLLAALKSCLKTQGKTYADVAQVLDLSEASVKRMFSEQSFSLARLDAVCHMLNMEISDLVSRMHESDQQLEQLTFQQEQEITQDLLLVAVTVCMLNHWTLEDIISYFAISEEECLGKLLKLDKLNIIELQPGNRVKLRISPNFHWLENGPFERFFREHVGREYFNNSFQGERQRLLVLNGALSKRSGIEFQRKLERLAREFNALSKEDAALPIEERDGVTLVLAMRNWDYGLFRHLTRQRTG